MNQILSKDLHNTDEACLAYTTRLMDKLEQVTLAFQSKIHILNAMCGSSRQTTEKMMLSQMTWLEEHMLNSLGSRLSRELKIR